MTATLTALAFIAGTGLGMAFRECIWPRIGGVVRTAEVPCSPDNFAPEATDAAQERQLLESWLRAPFDQTIPND